MFGNDHWLDWFMITFPEERSFYDKHKRKKIIRNVIMSDNPKACEIIQKKFGEYFLTKKSLQDLVISRGKVDVIKAMKLTCEAKVVDDVYGRFPKSEEFEYHDSIANVKSKFFQRRGKKVCVPIKTLLKELKVPTVHYKYDDIPEIPGCPDHCKQKPTCYRIRLVHQLILEMVNEIAKKYPIFRNSSLIVVGSNKEGTKGRR